jgi:hypothetical protein
MPAQKFNHSDFSDAAPPAGKPLQLLCEDEAGKYLLPFRCEWRNGDWHSIGKDRRIEVKVVGWRTWRT